MLKNQKDVGEMLSSEHAQQKAVNRSYLLKVLQNVVYLARQGMPMRGNWVPEEEGGGCERDSNFHQLMLLRASDDPGILEIMQRKTPKYTDHHIQNELLKVVALGHLRTIASEIRESGYFALESDEVTDSSNQEQIIVCLRWVDSKLEAHEDFIGLHHVDDITTNTVVHILKDTLLRMNLNLSMCRAQCYDGASNMKKAAKEIKVVEPRALYLHCFGHSLNLAVADTMKGVKVMSDVLDHALEICKLLKFSPRRDAIFHKLKEELSPHAPGLRNLCPTRWTVRALSLESIRVNYETLEATWEEALAVARESEVKARINGVAAVMKTFGFLFGLMLAERILKHTDNLSKTIQASSISAVEACSLSQMCTAVFEKIRTDLCFDQFWGLVERTRESLNVCEPVLPRRRKRPRRYEDGTAEPYQPDEPKVYYRQIYFQSIDAAVVTIRDRFNQGDYTMYAKLEQVVLLAAKNGNYSSELQEVVDFYGDDFNKSELETQLEVFSQMEAAHCTNPVNFKDVHKHLQSLPASQMDLISQVVHLVKLVLLMPATNAVSERSASAMRCIKTYLRSSMTQTRLNNAMVVHIHKHLTDSLDYAKVLNEFVSANEDRRARFGKF